MVPDFLHVFPGLDDTSTDGVSKVKDTSLGLSVITDVVILLSNTLHLATLVLGSADNGREDTAGCLLSTETGLNHT